MAGLKNTWVGTWPGGRIQEGSRGKTWWLERRKGGKRYAIRLMGVVSDPQAVKELGRWEKDPEGYQPPAVRDELARLETEEAALAKEESETKRVVITDALLDEWIADAKKGYGSRSSVSAKCAWEGRHYVTKWRDGPLKDRDLRDVTRAELVRHVTKQKTAQRQWVRNLKSFTRWLRWRGLLDSANDPTRDLETVPSRDVTEQEREARIYDPEQLAAVYRHLDYQPYRDAYRVRLMTGVHLSELQRLASGLGVVEVVKDGGEIAGVARFPHKKGSTHVVSLDAPTLAALQRLREHGTLGKLRNEDLTEAATLATTTARKANPKADEVEPVRLANLRATFITHAVRSGRLVQPPSGGVPLEIVAQAVGHTGLLTAKRHYLGSYVPPLVSIAHVVTLEHPEDPVAVVTSAA